MICVLAAELENLQLNVRSMLDDEIAWLGNFVPSESADLSDVDNSLLAGHLRFIRTLFACSSIDKSLFGTTETLHLGTLLDVSLPSVKSPSFCLL